MPEVSVPSRPPLSGSGPDSSWAARGLVRLIAFYQGVISPVPPALFGAACGCRFSPTCSHYAIEAVRSRGALGGSWLAFRRLLKCTPLHRGGFDPVPPFSAAQRTPPACTRIAA